MLYSVSPCSVQITVDHRQLPERNRLRAIVDKKLGNYKNGQPLFTRKERILKLSKLRDLFFF